MSAFSPETVGRQARLELVFKRQGSRTILERAHVESPLKVTRPYWPDESGQAHLILMSPAPGIFGGDEWDLQVSVKSGASAHITPQGALRVHPDVQAQTARQRVHLRVESGGTLFWEMEPVIPFRGSSLQQTIHLELQDGARLFFWDGFCAGRVQSGERWEFARLEQDLRLERDGQLLLLDRFLLEPQSREVPLHDMNECFTALLHPASSLSQLDPEGLSPRLQSAASRWGLDEPAPGLFLLRGLVQEGVTRRRDQAQWREFLIDQWANPLSTPTASGASQN